MTGARVRTLVVDDSMTARALLVAILGQDPDVEVVGEATSGAAAVAAVQRLRPSLVVMDIDMPEMDGFEACRQIMATSPVPIVIVTASLDPRDVATSLRATEVGALAVLPKPPPPSSPERERAARRFVAVVKALADVKVVRRRTRTAATAPRRSAGQRRLQAVAVVASTGGPAALHRFLEALPAAPGMPVLVVQHIAEGFTGGLLRWLSTATPLPVKLAEHCERLAADTVYLAPEGLHIAVGSGRRITLDGGPPVAGFRPSASVLLRSVAAVFGAAGAGVILTGMGRDGVDGARELRARGGLVLAQDERTSAVFGMPRAVIDAGLADVVGSVEELAAAIEGLRESKTGRGEHA